MVLNHCNAVEVAVRSLEDDPVFDAGHGSVLNKAGEVEMDAIIVDGSESVRGRGVVSCGQTLSALLVGLLWPS